MSGAPRKPKSKGAGSGELTTRAGVVSPARRCALDALRRVEDEAAYSSAVLAAGGEGLQAHDRALCHEIVLGCLRRQLWLDACIKRFAKRDPARLDAEVRRALRAGLYQLRYLTRIPASAVVNETVAHVRAAGFASAAGFANAVLRSAVREPEYDPAVDAANYGDELDRLAIATSHPRRLLERWIESFGRSEAEALARADNEPPAVAFRINSLHPRHGEALDELRAAGAELVASTLVPGAWRVRGANAALRELEAAGVVYVQSEASQLVAHALDARPGERILDACAAPGGKTTHVAILTKDDSRIVAGDLHPHRLRLMRRLTERQDLRSLRLVALDAAHLPFADNSFDRVLVDAPCTGTGTLRHNPEIRWRVTDDSIRRLGELQTIILRDAARTVRPGGRLVYSTCSLEPEENEAIVAAFLNQSPQWRIVADALPAELRTSTGAARTYPHRHDTDGFFVQVLERSDE